MECSHGRVPGWCMDCLQHGIEVTGSDNPHYDFGPDVHCVADLTDHMGFNQGNILKAVIRWGQKRGTSLIYDLEKIIASAERDLRSERLRQARLSGADAEQTRLQPESVGLSDMQEE